MTLQGIPGMTDTFRAFVQNVRVFLRDHAELNRLTAGQETSDREIAWAVLDALSNFNGTPPLGNVSLEDLLGRGQVYLLTRMTACSIIESVGLLQTRNHINYSDGGINTGVNDKTPLIMGWLRYFQATTEQRKLQVKVALNIESIMGPGSSGVHSELWAVNATYVGF